MDKIRYCFNIMRLKKLIEFAKPEYIASNKVIDKCGFSLMGTIKIDGDNYYYYKLKKDEWEHKTSASDGLSLATDTENHIINKG